VASTPLRSGPQRIADILGAACAALLAFTAVPAVLVVIVGNPLAGGLGHAWRPLSRDLLCVLVLAAWVAWVACCAQLVRAVIARVRSGDVATARGASVLDRVAARIAFGVLALASVGTPLSLAASAGASAPAAASVATALPAPSPPLHPTLPPVEAQTEAAVRVKADAEAPVYAVQPGDTLWGIAEDLFGDGGEWTTVAALNLGRAVGDGARLVDPDHLRAGWHLRQRRGRGRIEI
jgi:hypothetical protein